MSEDAQTKKPINRKMIWMMLYGIMALGIVGVVVAIFNDPRKDQKAEDEAAEQKKLAELPVGKEEAATSALDKQQAELDHREALRKQQEERERSEFDAMMGAGQGEGTSQAQAQGYDPEMLRMLDEAQRQAGGSPDLARDVPLPPLNDGASGGAQPDGKQSLIHDNYSKGMGQTVADSVGSDMFGDEGRGADAGGGETPADKAADGIYEALRPALPPSVFLLNQGSAIPAVLMSRIDTRNAGPITAMVTRTVFDSRTSRIPLIPQGSRLIGAYDTNVSPGVDRIGVQFTRLMLPDGRAFDLPAFPTSGGDGTIGMSGKYKSNLLQAIGPSFVVAVMGQVIDRQVRKEIPTQDASVQPGGAGGMYQSPSVLEQVAPKLNEAVMQRYQGAKPYFVVQPGQKIRVILTHDLEVPSMGVGGTSK